MANYTRTIVEAVDAFMFGFDEYPQWFKDKAFLENKISIYGKTATTKGYCVIPESDSLATDGDYVVFDGTNIFGVTQFVFEGQYKKVPACCGEIEDALVAKYSEFEDDFKELFNDMKKDEIYHFENWWSDFLGWKLHWATKNLK